jgi:elongation factor G
VTIPSAYRRAIEEALRLEAEVGPRFGFPLGEVRIRIEGGHSDPKRDAEMGFVQAAAQALRAALAGAEVALCEPWMGFEIQTPAEFASGILADLNARHAELQDVTQDGSFRTFTGKVALSKMFGYSTAVRSLSQGRASFSMVPAGYTAVPESELEARGLTWR